MKLTARTDNVAAYRHAVARRADPVQAAARLLVADGGKNDTFARRCKVLSDKDALARLLMESGVNDPPKQKRREVSKAPPPKLPLQPSKESAGENPADEIKD